MRGSSTAGGPPPAAVCMPSRQRPCCERMPPLHVTDNRSTQHAKALATGSRHAPLPDADAPSSSSTSSSSPLSSQYSPAARRRRPVPPRPPAPAAAASAAASRISPCCSRAASGRSAASHTCECCGEGEVTCVCHKVSKSGKGQRCACECASTHVSVFWKGSCVCVCARRSIFFLCALQTRTYT